MAETEALHLSDEGERREGGLRERCEQCCGGQEGRISYDLLLSCQCDVSPARLRRVEYGMLVAGGLAGTLEREK